MRASRAGAVPFGGHRHGAMRSGSVDDAEASSRPPASRAGGARDVDRRHRPRRSERDARRRGRDASEAVPTLPPGIPPVRARRSELATRRGRRDASEPSRRGALWGHRHGAMRSGSVDDAEASSRPASEPYRGRARRRSSAPAEA